MTIEEVEIKKSNIEMKRSKNLSSWLNRCSVNNNCVVNKTVESSDDQTGCHQEVWW